MCILNSLTVPQNVILHYQYVAAKPQWDTVMVLHCDLVLYLRVSCSQNIVFWESGCREEEEEEEELLSGGTARYFCLFCFVHSSFMHPS